MSYMHAGSLRTASLIAALGGLGLDAVPDADLYEPTSWRRKGNGGNGRGAAARHKRAARKLRNIRARSSKRGAA